MISEKNKQALEKLQALTTKAGKLPCSMLVVGTTPPKAKTAVEASGTRVRASQPA